MKQVEEPGSIKREISRKSWLSILAKSSFSEIQTLWDKLELNLEWELIRKPEIGMVMVQGRTGGNGQAFNLGEMTVTRAAVRLKNGSAGLGYVQGRSKKQAELCAVIDATLQTPANHSGGGVCLGRSYAHSRRGLPSFARNEHKQQANNMFSPPYGL